MKITKNPGWSSRLLAGASALLLLGALTAAASPTHQLLLDTANHPTDNVDLADAHWTGTLAAARLPGIPFPLLTGRPATLGGYGITDAATAAQGALAATALQPTGDGSALTAATGRDVSGVTNGGYNVACFGDSLTAGVGSSGGSTYPAQLAALIGNRHVDDFGIGGLTAAQILAQEVQVHPDKLQGLAIIWAGRNDVTVPTPAATVLANVASMVALLPAPKNFVVLSVLNATGEPSGSANYNYVASLNASLASAYGAHYLDVRSFLVAQYNPASPQDVADHGNDVPPTSLHASGDGVHLNNAGYGLVASFLASHAAAWGGAQTLATNTGVGGILANGPAVGAPGTPATGFYRLLGVGLPATSSNAGMPTYPTAPLQAAKPAAGSNTAAKFSSPLIAAGDLTQLEFTYAAGGDAGAVYRMAAIGAQTGSGGGGDLIFYTAPTATGAYADRLHVQRDGGIALNGADASGNILLGAGNLGLTSPLGSYPSTLTVATTAWNGADAEGWTANFVGTKSGAVNGVSSGYGYYGASGAFAWKTGGALAPGGTADAAAQMKLDGTGLTLNGAQTLLPQAAAPAPPASGVTLYVDSAGNLHALHSTGTNHVISAP